MTEQTAETRQKQIEGYRAYIAGVQKIYGDNISLLDSKILTLSAGPLGLSLTFITDLVDLSSSSYIYLLIFSWIMFGASILTVLFGLRYATSIKTTRETLDTAKQVAGLGNYVEKGPDPEAAKEKSDSKNERIDSYNKFALWMFVVALVALMAFISINILVQ